MNRDWETCLADFKLFLQIDKSLSSNSINAYLHDIGMLEQYILNNELNCKPAEVNLELVRDFLKDMKNMEKSSQARIISGLRAFFKFLLIDDEINVSPVELLESPKPARKLPSILSFEEIQKIEDGFDLSKPENYRNKAIIETLYSCGLRVSECTNLKIQDLHFEDGFINVIGKGNKNRLVPIGNYATNLIYNYMRMYRNQIKIQKGNEQYVFLNRRGKKLSREMIFIIIRQAALAAGIKKKVSPHSFRHAFATHLIEGGADLRSVQSMLGHENISTTEIYTHLDTHFLEDTIRNFHPRYKK